MHNITPKVTKQWKYTVKNRAPKIGRVEYSGSGFHQSDKNSTAKKQRIKNRQEEKRAQREEE